MWREPPWLSRLSATETWEVIGASGQKANSLYWAPELGWAVSGFGTANLQAWDCALLSPPNMQHTSPYRERLRDICLAAEIGVPEGLGRAEVSNPAGGFGLCFSQTACHTQRAL